MPLKNTPPRALFDTVDTIQDRSYTCVNNYLSSLPIDIDTCQAEFELTRRFLASYAGSSDTYNAYRREAERFVQWCWLVAETSLKTCSRDDLQAYLAFAQKPPGHWIQTRVCHRFINDQGQKQHNPNWRPFVATASKAERRLGKTVSTADFVLTNSAMQALFAGLSTFFTYLIQEGYVQINPVQLIRQKNRYIQKIQTQKVTRKLSQHQWLTVINTIEAKANQDSIYERHLFLLSLFYLLGLRISEAAETPGRIPKMSDFAPDKTGRWWFSTVSKGNKLRDVAVPDAMLTALKRYRLSQQSPPLPARGEHNPLINKLRGRGGLGPRQVRNLIQNCFDLSIEQLNQTGHTDEAHDLATATVHWLRHTAISADVEHRPREHVRDDAGHESAMVTDRYIDIDRIARHDSARNKQIRHSSPINHSPSKQSNNEDQS